MQISLLGQMFTTLWIFVSLYFFKVFVLITFKLYLLYILFQEFNRIEIIYGYFAILMFFNTFYCIGLGPIPWFLPAELFTHSSRTVAVCLTTVSHWFANFLMSQSLYILKVNHIKLKT